MAKYKTDKRKAEIGERKLVTEPVIGEYTDKLLLSKVYDKGFADGVAHERGKQTKVDAVIDKGICRYGKTLGKLADDTAQEKRDRIVGRAKMDVEGLIFEMPVDTTYNFADFIVNKEKRTVVVLLRTLRGGRVFAKGIAKCAPNDCFNVHIGKAIALRRALGHNVPHEYLNAPQPTEVRVGDIFKVPHRDRDFVISDLLKIEVVQSDFEAGRFKIIDDSRDEEAK